MGSKNKLKRFRENDTFANVFQPSRDDLVKAEYEMKGNCEICIKIAGDFLSDEDKARFYETFGDYCDRISIENTAPCWPEFDVEDRMGLTITEGIYNQKISETDTCPYIFYSMAVNSDGTVSLCFLDWARKLLIGDVRKQSLKSIWEGDLLYGHQVEHLKGNRKNHPVCGKCGQLSHCLPDNIDPFAGMLLEKLQAARGR